MDCHHYIRSGRAGSPKLQDGSIPSKIHWYVQAPDYVSRSKHLTASTDNTETVVTIVLVMEIFLRFVVDWRHFHMSRRNWVDLSLAVITAIIQIPAIRQLEQPYAWLTFFQIVRIYRVVLAVSLTRDLIVGPRIKLSMQNLN